jgi:phosphate transport system protein
VERVVRHFQEELGVLQERLLAMGGFAEERVREAVLALVSRDAALVDLVLSGDEPINDLHIEIDDRCFKLLALHQPMAADLRAIVAAVKPAHVPDVPAVAAGAGGPASCSPGGGCC